MCVETPRSYHKKPLSCFCFFDGHGVTEGEPQTVNPHTIRQSHSGQTPHTHNITNTTSNKHTTTPPHNHTTTQPHNHEAIRTTPRQVTPTSQAKPNRATRHHTTPSHATPKQATPKTGQVIRSRPFPVQGECSRCQRLTRGSPVDPDGKGGSMKGEGWSWTCEQLLKWLGQVGAVASISRTLQGTHGHPKFPLLFPSDAAVAASVHCLLLQQQQGHRSTCRCCSCGCGGCHCCRICCS